MRLIRMSSRGDQPVAEWNSDVSEETLTLIEKEFNHYLEQGWFAADLRTNTLIREFNKDADILLMPRVVGG